MLQGWCVDQCDDACRPRGRSADDTELTMDIKIVLRPGCCCCCSVIEQRLGFGD